MRYDAKRHQQQRIADSKLKKKGNRYTRRFVGFGWEMAKYDSVFVGANHVGQIISCSLKRITKKFTVIIPEQAARLCDKSQWRPPGSVRGKTNRTDSEKMSDRGFARAMANEDETIFSRETDGEPAFAARRRERAQSSSITPYSHSRDANHSGSGWGMPILCLMIRMKRRISQPTKSTIECFRRPQGP